MCGFPHAPTCARLLSHCAFEPRRSRSLGNFLMFFPGFVCSVKPSDAEIKFTVARFPLQHLVAGEQLVQGAVSSVACLPTVATLKTR